LKPIALQVNQLVKLVWGDSSYLKGWHYPPHNFGETTRSVEAVGYVVASDANVLTIAGNIDRAGRGALCPTFIPWGSVQKLEKLA
jgi:hypothetical protein